MKHSLRTVERNHGVSRITDEQYLVLEVVRRALWSRTIPLISNKWHNRRAADARPERPTHLDRDQPVLRILPPALQQRLFTHPFKRVRELASEEFHDGIGLVRRKRSEFGVERGECRVVGKEGEGEGLVLRESILPMISVLHNMGAVPNSIAGAPHLVRERDEHELAARPDVQVVGLEEEGVVRARSNRELEVGMRRVELAVVEPASRRVSRWD